jgi:hypothetical protein
MLRNQTESEQLSCALRGDGDPRSAAAAAALQAAMVWEQDAEGTTHDHQPTSNATVAVGVAAAPQVSHCAIYLGFHVKVLLCRQVIHAPKDLAR